MIQKIKSYLRNQKGEIDPLIILFFVFLGIAIITTSVEPFLIRQKVVQISNEIVEEVEYNGVIDSSTTSHINSLIGTYNISKYHPKWKFEGAIMPSGKIQLRDEFDFKMEVTVPLKFANIGDSINIKIPIKKQTSGRSQVYYRPSEL